MFDNRNRITKLFQMFEMSQSALQCRVNQEQLFFKEVTLQSCQPNNSLSLTSHLKCQPFMLKVTNYRYVHVNEYSAGDSDAMSR